MPISLVSPIDHRCDEVEKQVAERSSPALNNVDTFDDVVICGTGDLSSLQSLFGDVRDVASVGLFVGQLRLVIRHGCGVLCRLVELADLAEVEITLVIVVRQDS